MTGRIQETKRVYHVLFSSNYDLLNHKSLLVVKFYEFLSDWWKGAFLKRRSCNSGVQQLVHPFYSEFSQMSMISTDSLTFFYDIHRWIIIDDGGFPSCLAIGIVQRISQIPSDALTQRISWSGDSEVWVGRHKISVPWERHGVFFVFCCVWLVSGVEDSWMGRVEKLWQYKLATSHLALPASWFSVVTLSHP